MPLSEFELRDALLFALCEIAPLGFAALAKELTDEALAGGTALELLEDLLYNPDQPRDENGRWSKDGEYRVHPETKKVVHRDEVEKWRREQEEKKKKEEKPKPEKKERKPREKKEPKEKKPKEKKDTGPRQPDPPRPKDKAELLKTIKNDPLIQQQVKAIQDIDRPAREKLDKAHAAFKEKDKAVEDLARRRDSGQATGAERAKIEKDLQKLNRERIPLWQAFAAEREEYAKGAEQRRARFVEIMTPPRGQRHTEKTLGVKSVRGDAGVSQTEQDKVLSESKKAADFFRGTLAKTAEHGEGGRDDSLVSYVRALDRSGRAHFTPHTHWIALSSHDSTDVAVHEWGHYIEDHVPGAHRATLEFLDHRVGGEKPVSMKKVFPYSSYDAHEMGREDDFAKAFNGDRNSAFYAGKDYGGKNAVATEIISMGIQEMYKDPGGFTSRDPEYAGFIVGILNGRARFDRFAR